MQARPEAPWIAWLFLFGLALFGLQGCSNQYQEEVKDRSWQVNQRLSELKRSLEAGSLSNALIIETYARRLETSKPEFREVAKQLKKDATHEGTLYQGLVRRFSEINQKPGNKQEFAAAYQELDALWAASDLAVFNDALLDIVNTLADLSDGELERVNIPENAQTAAVKGGSGAVPGSYLVGNPGYGHWRQDSSGRSFWEWYGMYSLFSNVVGGFGGGYYRGPVYYNDWYSRPRYSYYHDWGRDTYGTRTDRSTWRTGKESMARKGVRPATPKNYGSTAGRKRASTYASMRSRTNAALRSGRLPSSTATAKRTSSFFGSSSRGTSRRSWGGK